MPDLAPRQGSASTTTCDALGSPVAIASNQTATIAVRTAGASFPFVGEESPC